MTTLRVSPTNYNTFNNNSFHGSSSRDQQSGQFIIKLSLILIFSVLISSLYLWSKSNDDVYIAQFNQLSHWYLIDSLILSIGQYAAIVILPYLICFWISRNEAWILFVIVCGIDELFRLFWYVDDLWLRDHKSVKAIYLATWEFVDDFNIYFIVPFIVALYVRRKFLKLQLANNTATYAHTIHHSHFNLIGALYILAATIYLALDVINFYKKGEDISSPDWLVFLLKFVRMTSVLAIAFNLVYETNLCNHHKSKFTSIVLMFVLIIIQESLHQWTVLVMVMNQWVLKHPHSNLATIGKYICNTIYFQVLSFLCDQMINYISWKGNHKAYEMTFIFTIYRDTFLTMFLELSVTMKWYTILSMIATKLFAKFMQFNHTIQGLKETYLKSEIDIDQLAVSYIYELLSTFCVYVAQILFLVVDYTTNGIWMVHAEETKYNLAMCILVILITFCAELFAFGVVKYVSKKSSSRRYRDNYSINNLKAVRIPSIYFCLVIVYAQTNSMRTTKGY